MQALLHPINTQHNSRQPVIHTLKQ